MLKLSKKEKLKYGRLIPHTTKGQLIRIAYWLIFKPHRMNKFHNMVMNGIDWKVAYEIVKQSKI